MKVQLSQQQLSKDFNVICMNCIEKLEKVPVSNREAKLPSNRRLNPFCAGIVPVLAFMLTNKKG